MPADISLMIGGTPHFSYDMYPLHYKGDSFHSASKDDFDHPAFSRVPQLSLMNLKSCLRNGHEHPNQFCDFHDSEESEKVDDDDVLILNHKYGEKSPKKHVTFADAEGGTLTSVKYVSEASNEPPQNLSSRDLLTDYLRDLTLSGVNSSHSNPTVKLCLQFSQPAADYVTFKRKLDDANVSLENMVINSVSSVHGTVKVKNIAFNKKVTARISFDDWSTFTDVQCEYVNNAYENGVYDTFQFIIDVPPSFYDKPNLIQFCICFECESKQFWDNNGGKNYCISFSDKGRVQKAPPSRKQPLRPYPSTYTELPRPEDPSWPSSKNLRPFY